MFKSMRLKNFKAYKDSGEVPLAPLTVIVGANNSGKSTLFHALLLLKQTAQDREQRPFLLTNGDFIELNGFYDILNKDAATRSSFDISLTLDQPARISIESEVRGRENTVQTTPSRFDVAFVLNKRSGKIEVLRSTFWSGEKRMLDAFNGNGKWQSDMFTEDVPEGAEIVYRSMFPRLSFPVIHGTKLGALSARFMDVVDATNISSFVWVELLRSSVHHVGPLRRRVPWQTSVGARTSSEIGLSGENLLAALRNEENVPGTKKTLLELLNEWVSKTRVLKGIHLVEIDKSRSVFMLRADEWGGQRDINVASMGEGISQMLPIIANSIVSQGADCLLVEQPEIHLHPALQAELADLFIKVMKTGRRQILVETHSEHLLLRIRRRIAEGTVNPEQVAILFVEKDGGESKVHHLDLNSRGHFSDWPKGFFDEAYQEAMALATAASRKG
jgi:predicted ATPase